MNKAKMYVLAAACVFAGTAHGADDAGPLWAYPQRPQSAANVARPPENTSLKTVPNSILQRTLRQAQSSADVPDWHPDNHPAAPDVILHGRAVVSEACGHCHLPNGIGGPMTAPALAGLPSDYILRALADFKSGARKSAVKWSSGGMMSFVVKANDGADFLPEAAADLKRAADYYAALPAKQSIKVAEAKLVPQVKYDDQIYIAVEGAPKEPIGNRIVEVPESPERTTLRDSETGFIAYVPPGSLKRGETLITTGAKGTTTPCTICHGSSLQGLGPVPPIAGRSPSYIARQLYDIQQGARGGAWSALMVPVVAKLTPADMVAIAAYVSSQAP
jgi:cytochrome c553